MENPGVTQIKRQMMIHNVAQGLLMVLLLFGAMKFQQVYAEAGALNAFFNSILLTMGLQILLFYPIYRFARKEVQGELATQSTKKPEEQKVLRQKKIFGNFSKAAVFIFYTTFMLMAPTVTLVISTAFFSLIATTLTYLQSFNFAAKKLVAPPKKR